MMKPAGIFLLLSTILICCKDEEKGLLHQLPFASITDSIKIAPEDDGLYFRRAILLNKNNHPAEALQDFQTAWSIKPEESYALGISSLLLDKHPDSSIAFLHSAIRKKPTDLLQIGLARALIEKGQPQQALQIYNAILQTNSRQLNVLLMKIDLLKKTNDTIQLLPALEQAHAIDPTNSDVALHLAYEYSNNKTYKTIALADSLIGADTIKKSAEPYYIKGLYYAGIKDYPNAIEWFNETISHDHRHLNAFIEKGKVLIAQKKIAAARQTFELANKIAPAFPDAYYWIGQCQELNGLKQDARLSYEKAYSLDKSFIEAKEAAAKLN